MITHNANMLGERVQGSIRRGEALLAGLLRCGHCGRKLTVMYGGGRGGVGRYLCRDPKTSRTRTCISFGALRVDEAVCEEVLRRLQPLVRTCQYLNNIIEQDHRAIKRRCAWLISRSSCCIHAASESALRLAAFLYVGSLIPSLEYLATRQSGLFCRSERPPSR